MAEGGKCEVDGDIFFRSDHDSLGAGLDEGIGLGALANVGDTAGVDAKGVVCDSALTDPAGPAAGAADTGCASAGAGAGAEGGGGGAGMVKPLGPDGIGRSLLGPVGGISPRGPIGNRPPWPCMGTGTGIGSTRLTSDIVPAFNGGAGASRLKMPLGGAAYERAGGGEGERGRLRGDVSRSRFSGLAKREERYDEAVEGEREERRERGGGEREMGLRYSLSLSLSLFLKLSLSSPRYG